MSQQFKPFYFVCIIFLLMVGLFGLQKWLEPPSAVNWLTNLDQAALQSRQSQKPVIIYFSADWCPPCKAMKKNLWSNPQSAELLRAFTPVMIDVDAQQEVSRKYFVQQIPTLCLLNPDLSINKMRTGMLSMDELRLFLKAQ